MRGQALIDPAVVGALEPFIVTSWYGHREDKMPPQVAQVWKEKFSVPGTLGEPGQPGNAGQRRGGGHSNVDLAFLDSRGQVVYWADAMPNHSPASVSEAMLGALAVAATKMIIPRGRTRAIGLPPARQGVRVMTMLDDPGMVAYRAPVVEVRPVDWSALARPPATGTAVSPEVLGQALRTMYPAGVMDRTDPVSKKVYPISKVTGDLFLRPISAYQAILSGTVRLQDAGPDGFAYQGQLRVVLSYDATGQVQDCEGFFEAQYPRYDPRRQTWRYLPLTSILERD